jgi:hypothetical protein
MKFVGYRPLADPVVAARKLLELANAVEPVQDARIHIEKINGPFLFKEGGRPASRDSTTPSRRAGFGYTKAGDLLEVHPGRRGAVRLIGTGGSGHALVRASPVSMGRHPVTRL